MAAPQAIGPVLAWVLGVLQQMTEEQYGGLAPFAEFHQSWTWVVINWPSVGVMPMGSQFDPEIVGARYSVNRLKIKFGVNGADPDQVTADAIAYMLAIDAAIQAADLNTPCANSKRLFVADHDYGPLWSGPNGGAFAKFPEMHLDVEIIESL
jgi:hypothetical protein